MLSGYEYEEQLGEIEVVFFFLAVDLHRAHRRDLEIIGGGWIFNEDLGVIPSAMAGQYIKSAVDKLEDKDIPRRAIHPDVHDPIHEPQWKWEGKLNDWLWARQDGARMWVRRA